MLLISIIVVAVVAYLLVRAAVAAHRARKLQEQPWKPQEFISGNFVHVQLEKPGEEPHLVGRGIDRSLPYYEYEAQLEELWLEAQLIADGKNRRLKA